MISKPTPYQKRILEIPQPTDRVLVVNLLGARSAGRTTAGFFAIARHLAQHGEDARILVVRKRLKSLQQYIDDLAAVMKRSLDGVTMNRNVHTISLNGTTDLSFGAVDAGNVLEYAGRNHTALIVEEAGDIDPALVSQLALTLRKVNNDHNGNPLPMMFWRLGNPGGSAQLELYNAYVRDRRPWVPYEHGGFLTVTVPGGLEDNPHNPPGYADQFEALRSQDEGLYRAHRFGDWNAFNADTFFGRAFNHEENVVPVGALKPGDMRRFLWAGDWGTASPAAYILLGVTDYEREMPSGLVLPRGTIVAWDEFTTCIEGSLTKGDGRPPGKVIPYLVRKTALAGVGSISAVLDCAAGANVSGHGEQTVLDFPGLHRSCIRRGSDGTPRRRVTFRRGWRPCARNWRSARSSSSRARCPTRKRRSSRSRATSTNQILCRSATGSDTRSTP